jgi:hypothetical protein
LLFVTKDDCPEFRASVHGIVIETAWIYARHIDAVAESTFRLDELLSRLMGWLQWNIPGSVEDHLAFSLSCYDQRRAEAGPPKVRTPTIDFFMKFRSELRSRYCDELLKRTLPPFAFSLTSNRDRDYVIMDGTAAIDLASKWYESNSPKRKSAVQFFETVGLLTESLEHAQDALFIDGEVKRAITRGRHGHITLDAGDTKHFGDIAALVRWLS